MPQLANQPEGRVFRPCQASKKTFCQASDHVLKPNSRSLVATSKSRTYWTLSGAISRQLAGRCLIPHEMATVRPMDR